MELTNDVFLSHESIWFAPKNLSRDASQIEAALAKKVARGAASFYRERGRHFAWRDERNPYRLAVAEILLQKTRAQSAAPIFDKLMQRFPTAIGLAAAEEIEIAAILLPLGLAAKRAVQLIKMARIAGEKGDAVFADYRFVLKSIPGLGAYAARAIACFSRGEALGIVDANVARILRRIFSVSTIDSRAVVYQQIADRVASSGEDPRQVNFGLLDLGAAICVRSPKCPQCPLASFCPRFGVVITN